MLSPKAKYRVACAREALEKAAEQMEAAQEWLDFEGESAHEKDVRFVKAGLTTHMGLLAQLDGILSDTYE